VVVVGALAIIENVARLSSGSLLTWCDVRSQKHCVFKLRIISGGWVRRNIPSSFRNCVEQGEAIWIRAPIVVDPSCCDSRKLKTLRNVE
jgi:hypothetical protein